MPEPTSDGDASAANDALDDNLTATELDDREVDASDVSEPPTPNDSDGAHAADDQAEDDADDVAQGEVALVDNPNDQLPTWPLRNLPRLSQGELFTRIANFVAVAGAAIFIIAMLHPELMLRNTTATGGDMGAHVWQPQYIRDHVLEHFRLSWWTPDYYAGMPAGQYYFPVPTLFQLFLDIFLPYNIAFKIGTVVGIALLPISAYVLGRGLGARRPVPAAMAVATLPFLFDRGWTIYGSNIYSAMAGMYSNAWSLAFAFFFLGAYAAALRTGKHIVMCGVLFALAVMSHVMPTYVVLVPGAVVITLAHLLRRRRESDGPSTHRLTRTFVIARERWRVVLVVAVLGALLCALWVVPFITTKQWLTDMGWEALPEGTRSVWSYLLPANNPGASSYAATWMLFLASLGALVGIALGRRAAMVATVMWISTGAAFALATDFRIWNARILPFWFLWGYLLAAMFIGELARSLPYVYNWMKRAATWTRSLRYSLPAAAVFGGAATIMIGFAFYDRQRQCNAGSFFYSIVKLFAPNVGRPLPSDQCVDTVVENAKFMPPLNDFFQGLAGVLITIGAIAFVLGLGLVVESLVRRSIVSVADQTPMTMPQRGFARALPTMGLATFAIAILIVVGLPLSKDGVLFGNVTRTRLQDIDGTEQNYSWLPFKTDDSSGVRGWARWNFSGYEDLSATQPKAWLEYDALNAAMVEVGATNGCGRALWDYESEYNRFGTTLALMLLPYWTEGCISSMEGIYFEASSTTPYHFLNSAVVGKTPSNPMRDMAYGAYDLAEGVARMQFMGIKYYMTLDATIQADADALDSLKLVKTVGPFPTSAGKSGEDRVWKIYEVQELQMVEALQYEPVVLSGVPDPNSDVDWLRVTLPWYQTPSARDVYITSDGPDGWSRFVPIDDYRESDVCVRLADLKKKAQKKGVTYDVYIADFATEVSGVTPDERQRCEDAVRRNDPEQIAQFSSIERRPLTDVEVTNVVQGDDFVSFSVDKVGTPVVVKTSYFPNWKVEGAQGPFRAGPNQMIVIPTSNDVRVYYAWTNTEIVSYLATAMGIVFALWLVIRRRHLAKTQAMVAGTWADPDPDPDEDVSAYLSEPRLGAERTSDGPL